MNSVLRGLTTMAAALTVSAAPLHGEPAPAVTAPESQAIPAAPPTAEGYSCIWIYVLGTWICIQV